MCPMPFVAPESENHSVREVEVAIFGMLEVVI